MKKGIVITLAYIMAVSALLSGCVVAEPDVTEPATSETTTEETVTTTTTEEETYPTYSKRVVNHGHSISETDKKRPHEIKRITRVIFTQDEASEFLKENVSFKTKGITLKLTDTSASDPGAFMWYQYTVYYNDIKVKNAEFYILTFIDGSICEGKTNIKTCSFANPKDVLDQEKALAKYAEKFNDTKEYKFEEMFYYFTGKKKEKCKLQYSYRYETGDPKENCTIFLDAATGDFIGLQPDEID